MIFDSSGSKNKPDLQLLLPAQQAIAGQQCSR
jgi:hypothetical protein